MTKNRLIAGVALMVLLVLLGAIAGCAVGLEQPETVNTLTIQGRVIVDAYHYDEATGEYVQFYHHESENILTTIGIDWIAKQLGGTPDTDPAKWISLSLDTTETPLAAWTQIPDELTTIPGSGLARKAGTYDHTASTNTWTIEATFTADATFTAVQLTGLQWAVGPPPDSTLMAANHFDPVTLNSGDALTITWELTLS